jgi:hypothetical protein
MAESKEQHIVCITGERETREFLPTMKQVFCELIWKHADKLFVIFGECTGVDACAYEICKDLSIRHKMYVAQWSTYGKSAGPLRNKQMIEVADEVYAFHRNISYSKGTKNTIAQARAKGIPVHYFDS